MPTSAPTDRDVQRARVYRAEDDWAARLDAARLGAPLARVGDSQVLLPAERRFGTLETAQVYADAVLDLPAVRALGAVPSVVLRIRRGVRAAHWEPPGVIALPVSAHGEPWALRESVLLHELAHHVGETRGLCRRHSAPFPAVVLLLAEAVLGVEAALALRISYGEQRVEVGGL